MFSFEHTITNYSMIFSSQGKFETCISRCWQFGFLGLSTTVSCTSFFGPHSLKNTHFLAYDKAFVVVASKTEMYLLMLYRTHIFVVFHSSSIAWFKNEEAVVKAVDELHGKYIDGSVLLVKAFSGNHPNLEEPKPAIVEKILPGLLKYKSSLFSVLFCA